jgi:hypothetical protein
MIEGARWRKKVHKSFVSTTWRWTSRATKSKEVRNITQEARKWRWWKRREMKSPFVKLIVKIKYVQIELDSFRHRNFLNYKREYTMRMRSIVECMDVENWGKISFNFSFFRNSLWQNQFLLFSLTPIHNSIPNRTKCRKIQFSFSNLMMHFTYSCNIDEKNVY